MTRRAALACVGAFVVAGWVATGSLLAWSYPQHLFLQDTPGVSAGQAWDAAHGEFYRPVVDARGYGGTRYMPLMFLLHALLLRLDPDVLVTGRILMLGSFLLSIVAVALYLRSTGASAWTAGLLAATLPCTVPAQLCLLGLNCDYLAVAWIYLALAARRKRPWLAGALLVVAFLTKTSALYALPVAVQELWREGRRKPAVGLVGGVGLGCLLAVLLLQLASEGRFLDNFRFAGEATFSYKTFLAWPGGILTKLERSPFMTSIFVCSLLAGPRLLLTWTLLALSVIYLSPGTSVNHMADLHAACLPGVADLLEHPSKRRAPAAFFACMAIGWAASVLGLAPSQRATMEREGPPSIAVARSLLADYLPPGTPFLATNPALPLLRGERPILLDAFQVRQGLVRGGEQASDFRRRVLRGDFPWLVMSHKFGIFACDAAPGDPALARFSQQYWESDSRFSFLAPYFTLVEVRRPFIVYRWNGRLPRYPHP